MATIRLNLIGFTIFLCFLPFMQTISWASAPIFTPRTGKVFAVKVWPRKAADTLSEQARKKAKACLQAFDRRLKEALENKSYDESYMSCEGCDKLNEPGDKTELKFHFSRDHQQHFAHFAQAWSYLQQETDPDTGDEGYPDCYLDFDASIPDQPLCGPPVPQPCYVNYLCVGTNPKYCSKNAPSSGPCTSCAP